MEIILNRGGQAGGIKALYFNGKICKFIELPLPDTSDIHKWYAWLEKRKNKDKQKPKTTLFLLKVKHLFKS